MVKKSIKEPGKEPVKDSTPNNNKQNGNIRTTSSTRRAELIREHRAKQINKFKRMWNNPRYDGKDNVDKIIAIFRDYDIRSPEKGFTYDEMTSAIEEDQIRVQTIDLEQTTQELKQRINEEQFQHVRELLQKILIPLQLELQTARHRLRVNLVRGLVGYANRKYNGLEKIGIKPKYSQDLGNGYRIPMKKNHLLTDDDTLEERKEKRREQRKWLDKLDQDETRTTKSAQEYQREHEPIILENGEINGNGTKTKRKRRR